MHRATGGRNGDRAGVAQLVEQLICNQPVVGSNPIASSNINKGLREIAALPVQCRDNSLAGLVRECSFLNAL